MFDKLKEVKNFKEITDFSYNFYNVKYFKEKNIWRVFKKQRRT